MARRLLGHGSGWCLGLVLAALPAACGPGRPDQASSLPTGDRQPNHGGPQDGGADGGEAPPGGEEAGSGGSSGAHGGEGGSSGQGGAPMLTVDSGPPPGTPDAGPTSLTNCGDVVCRGAGSCQLNTDGVAICVCDPGYLLDDSMTECIVDETCVVVRLLEEGCRQRLMAEPAVGVFFAVETCAGTAVLPEELGDLEDAFLITENGQALPEESSTAILERDVESFVTIAVDLSTSVINDGDVLEPLIDELQVMVDSLRGDAGTTPVSISLIAIGRVAEVALEFTQDFDRVDDALAQMAADPESVITDPNGTDLNGAVNLGSRELLLAMDTRFNEANRDVLTRGTLVAVTDGDDTSGRPLAVSPRLSVITIGISAEIDNNSLTLIGSQGSFLAPSQDDWRDAFDRVSERVREYPESAYLLGYCSPGLAGIRTIEVGLSSLDAKQKGTCSFCAENFGETLQCNSEFFENYCDEHASCGSFVSCGECSAADGVNDNWQLGAGCL